MKKSVILIIAAVYILSVVIVGVIGIRLHVYDEAEYISEIRCVSVGVDETQNSPGKYNCTIKLDDFTPGDKVLIEIEYHTNKSDTWVRASKEQFDFVCEHSDVKLINNNDGTCYVEMKKATAVVVTIQANDSKKATYKVRLYAIDMGDIF